MFEAYFITKFSIDCVKNNLRNFLMEPLVKGKEVDYEDREKSLSCLKMVTLTDRLRIADIYDSLIQV